MALTRSELAAYAVRGVSLRIASRTDVGLVRANNEDRLVLGELAGGRPVLMSGRVGPAGVVFGVCDGMGGAAAGEVASRLAATTILQTLARAEVGLSAEAFQAALGDAIGRAGEAIRRDVELHPSRKGMGTTCTVAAVRGGLMLIGQVGDSRAYVLREGVLRQLTRDQNWANEMLARGHVSAEQAAKMENGKAIVQAVGTSVELEIELISLELRQGDKVLICSDGLSDMVSDEEMAGIIGGASDLEIACDELMQRARAGGGLDNITFVLCEFAGKGLPVSVGVFGDLEDLDYRLPVRRPSLRAAIVGMVAAVAIGFAMWRFHAGGERSAPLEGSESTPPVSRTTAPRDTSGTATSEAERARPRAGTESVAPLPAELAERVEPAFEKPKKTNKPVRRHAEPARRHDERRREEAPVQLIREVDPTAGSPF